MNKTLLCAAVLLVMAAAAYAVTQQQELVGIEETGGGGGNCYYEEYQVRGELAIPTSSDLNPQGHVVALFLDHPYVDATVLKARVAANWGGRGGVFVNGVGCANYTTPNGAYIELPASCVSALTPGANSIKFEFYPEYGGPYGFKATALYAEVRAQPGNC